MKRLNEILERVVLVCRTIVISIFFSVFFISRLDAATLVSDSIQPLKRNELVAERSVKDTLNVRTLEEVTVNANSNQRIAMETRHMGASTLSGLKISRIPVVLGEKDLIKALQMESGVAAGVEGFAGMFVHGGEADENQFYFNGIPIYQVNHAGGLFSAFNTDAINKVDFYKTTFPAKFDGRLSSYVDILTKEGNSKRIHGSATIGLASGGFFIEGPLFSKKTTFAVSGRR